MQLIVELDGIEVDKPVGAGADVREPVDDSLIISGMIGDIAEGVGVDTEQVEARGLDGAGIPEVGTARWS